MKMYTVKNRILAAVLTLVLLAALPFAVLGEEKSKLQPADQELVDMFKVPYEITDVSIGSFYRNKYVSEDGQTEKWFCSALPEIDGLKRTDEVQKIETDMFEPPACTIKEKHAHLYYDKEAFYLIPLYEEEKRMTLNGKRYKKTEIITQIDEEAQKKLMDYELYRLSDNICMFQLQMDYAKKHGFSSMLFMTPIVERDGELDVKVFAYNEDPVEYRHEEMNGYLFSRYFTFGKAEFEEVSEEEKVMTLLNRDKTAEKNKSKE